ncbi:UNVERIFIED_CONTAM: hypothetical protein K2H54_059101, partial [Gekko kuhli]
THLLIAQSGKIDHVPLDGNTMKKSDAKALLYVPPDAKPQEVTKKESTGAPEPSGNAQQKGDRRGKGEGTALEDKVVIGVAYDCLEKMVYWTDISSPSISRASLGGGEPTSIIKTAPAQRVKEGMHKDIMKVAAALPMDISLDMVVDEWKLLRLEDETASETCHIDMYWNQFFEKTNHLEF